MSRARRITGERARRADERAARRTSLLALLARLDRGALLDAERPLLRAHVEAELAEYDEIRRDTRTMGRVVQRHVDRAKAAEETITELERDRDQAARMAKAWEDTAHTYAQNAEQWQTRTKRAEAALARVQALAVDMREWCSPHGIAKDYAERIKQAIAGEAYQAAEQADTFAGRLDAIRQQATAMLAEAVAAAEERAEKAEAAASETAAEQHRRNLAAVLAMPAGTAFGDLIEYAAKTLTAAGERILAADRRAARAEAAANRHAKYSRKAAQRLDDMKRRADQAAERAAAAITAMGADIRDAEHRATRYRTAWLAARRDRKADRAAMAEELPYVTAGKRLAAGQPTAAEAAERLARWASAGTPAAAIQTKRQPCPDDCPCTRVCLNRTTPIAKP